MGSQMKLQTKCQCRVLPYIRKGIRFKHLRSDVYCWNILQCWCSPVAYSQLWAKFSDKANFWSYSNHPTLDYQTVLTLKQYRQMIFLKLTFKSKNVRTLLKYTILLANSWFINLISWKFTSNVTSSAMQCYMCSMTSGNVHICVRVRVSVTVNVRARAMPMSISMSMVVLSNMNKHEKKARHSKNPSISCYPTVLTLLSISYFSTQNSTKNQPKMWP